MSPTIWREKGYSFAFFANEGNEPAHVHVSSESRRAKFWLDPVQIADSGNFRARELGEAISIVRKKQKDFLREWENFERRRRGGR